MYRYLLAGIVLIISLESRSQDETDAEIAIRWSTVEVTSPDLTTIDAVSRLINPNGTPGKKDTYVVSYYKIDRPSGAPDEAIVIARKRIKNKKKYELMIKYRSVLSMKDYFSEWKCPLEGNLAGEGPERKYEVDISVGKDGLVKRLHSISCEIESGSPIDFPKNFNAREIGSPQEMNRVKVDKLKIEEVLGKKILEVSMPAKDSAIDIDSFYKNVALLLIEKGIIPDLENKSSK